MTNRDTYFLIANFIVGGLHILLTCTIFGLDVAILSKTAYRGSIAMASFNRYISYTGIYSGTIVLGIFYLFGVVMSIFISLPKSGFGQLVSTASIILFLIPREAIVYKFILCFNYTYYQLVQARACLTYVSIIVIVLLHIKFMLQDDIDEKLIKIAKIICFIVSKFFLIGILVLNIFMLINLKTDFTKDINPNSIKIGYFTPNEINDIGQNTFVKDSNYTSRFIGNLYDIIYSDDKKAAYSVCTKSSCTTYYLRKLNAEITCNSESDKFYIDCLNANKLSIQLKYLDAGAYPSYHCAVIYKNYTCSPGCPGLNNYNLYLVQEYSNQVEKAWNSFCNCEIEEPKIDLIEDTTLDICKNKSIKFKSNFFIIFIIVLITSFLYL